MKWLVGRHRPVDPAVGIAPFHFTPMAGGWTGLLTVKNLSFPSGDACLAFATAAALGMLVPRGRLVFFAVAAVVAMERVLENAHYVSDVAAAAGLGVLLAHLARKLLRRCCTPRPAPSPTLRDPRSTRITDTRGLQPRIAHRGRSASLAARDVERPLASYRLPRPSRIVHRMNQPWVQFLLTAAGVAICLTILALMLTGLAKLPRWIGDLLCRAPLLDAVVAAFTWVPWVVGAVRAGWAGVGGALAGQLVTYVLWVGYHGQLHRPALKGRGS